METEGHYFDGRSAARRAAQVVLGADVLEIRYDGVVETWPYALIRRRRQGDLTHLERAGETARLTISDPDFIDALAARSSALDRRSGPRRQILAIAAATLAVVALGVASVQVFPSFAARLVPTSWEERLGAQVVDMVAMLFAHSRDPHFCGGTAGAQAIDRLIATLSDDLDTSYKIRVRVLDTKAVNAFAAPGGYIVVLRGLIDFAESPDELAGTLAHEMGHVVHRHPTQGMFRQMTEGRLLGFMTGNASAGSATSAIADALVGASYTREAEAEADTTALDLLARAHISPQGMAAFFERFTAQGNSYKGSLLSTHPPDQTRSQLARERAAQIGDARPAMSAAEWQSVKAMCKA